MKQMYSSVRVIMKCVQLSESYHEANVQLSESYHEVCTAQ